jgi:hypothetical protein
MGSQFLPLNIISFVFVVSICIIFLLDLFIYFLFLHFLFPCKYNQINKHLRVRVLQRIISGELKGNHLFRYDEAFKEEKDAFRKNKFFIPLFFHRF